MELVPTLLLADTWGMHGGWWWIPMMFGMILFWALVIFGVVWLVRASATGWRSDGREVGPRETPLDVLDRRYAEGAITEDEYRERRENLIHGPRERATGGPSSRT